MSSVSEKRKTFNYWDDSSESDYFDRPETKKKTKHVTNDSNSPVNKKFSGNRATKINRMNNCNNKDKLHTKSNLFRNRPSSSRSNKVTVAQYNKVTNNEMSEYNSNKTDFVVRNICRKYRNQQAGQKLDIILNFKLYIIKIIEKSKHIFSTFKSQLNRFGLNYVKNEIETLEDAENIIFIINCILGEAKKELTQQQQELYRMYFQQKTKYKSKRLTLNAKNKQCVTKNLQAQFETCSESDSNNDSRFPNMHNKVSVTASKIPIHKSDSLKNKEPISQQPSTKNQAKLTLEGNCISMAQNDDSILSNSNESVEHVLHNLKEINLIKKPSNTSVVNFKTTKSNTLNVKPLKQKLKKTTEHIATVQQDSCRSTRMKRSTPIRSTLDYNSDVSSTCSTIAWWSFRNDSVQQNGRDENDLIDTNITQRENKSKSPILCTDIFDDDVQNSSHEGVDHARLGEGTSLTRSKGEHLNSEGQFIVPNVNMSSMKGKIKPTQNLNTSDIISKQKLTEKEKIVDKKLLMKCQVLINKFKLSNIETSQK